VGVGVDEHRFKVQGTRFEVQGASAGWGG
jgi:hypothetical protein